MKLDCLSIGDTGQNIIRLYAFNTSEAEVFARRIMALAEKRETKVDVDAMYGVLTLGACKLS